MAIQVCSTSIPVLACICFLLGNIIVYTHAYWWYVFVTKAWNFPFFLELSETIWANEYWNAYWRFRRAYLAIWIHESTVLQTWFYTKEKMVRNPSLLGLLSVSESSKMSLKTIFSKIIKKSRKTDIFWPLLTARSFAFWFFRFFHALSISVDSIPKMSSEISQKCRKIRPVNSFLALPRKCLRICGTEKKYSQFL